MNETGDKYPWELFPRQIFDTTRLDAPRRLATLTMGSRTGGTQSCELPPGTPLELAGDYQIAYSAFKAWLWKASSSDTDRAVWAGAAVRGARVVAGPVNVSDLSDPPVFANTDFATPFAWAQAEWDAQWDRFGRLWAAYWETLIPIPAPTWSVCRRVTRADVASNQRVLDAVGHLIGLYHGRIDGDIITFAGPGDVTAWVAQVVTTMNPPEGMCSLTTGLVDDDELHRVTIGLWSTDPNDALFHYDDALAAAAAILLPA